MSKNLPKIHSVCHVSVGRHVHEFLLEHQKREKRLNAIELRVESRNCLKNLTSDQKCFIVQDFTNWVNDKHSKDDVEKKGKENGLDVVGLWLVLGGFR